MSLAIPISYLSVKNSFQFLSLNQSDQGLSHWIFSSTIKRGTHKYPFLNLFEKAVGKHDSWYSSYNTKLEIMNHISWKCIFFCYSMQSGGVSGLPFLLKVWECFYWFLSLNLQKKSSIFSWFCKIAFNHL